MPKPRMARAGRSKAAPSPSRAAPRTPRAAALLRRDPLLYFKRALVASLLLHAAVLSVRFELPQRAINKLRDSQLEIVLVNSKSAARPDKAQARAQANLDGGGNTDEDRIAKSPLPPTRQNQGTEVIETRQRAREAEARSQRLTTLAPSKQSVPEQEQKVEQEQPSPAVGADLAQTALAMARLEAQIARNTEVYNKRPRKNVLGARAISAVEAMYSEQWRQKIERVGNLNYPDSAKGKLYGSLILVVEIRSDGTLQSAEISRSSGHRVLDDAALRIVRLAAPYGRFSDEMRNAYDVLVIARTWTFTSADRLQ